MNLCSVCSSNPASMSAIVDGVYHKHICSVCNSLKNQVSSGHARWSRSIDVEDHQTDIMQPWNSDGTMNLDFVRLYPKQAKALFTSEEIEKASRR